MQYPLRRSFFHRFHIIGFTGVVFLMSLCALYFVPPAVQAQAELTVQRNDILLDFPDSAEFRFKATSPIPITAATLEYGFDALNCGQFTNRQQLDIVDGESVDIRWRWNILEGLLLPRGADIWWQWRLTLDDGTEWLSERQTVEFIDQWFVWQSITRDPVTLHWYRGSRDMADQIMDSAHLGLQELTTDTGLTLTETVDIFLYEESIDFMASLPGAPPWAGGVAFPEHNIVQFITNDRRLDYGLVTVRHELAHVVIGRLTFNCLNDLPTWLNEGLAQVAEGVPDENGTQLLTEAVEAGHIVPIGQLEGAFSIHSDRAHLSYAQSYSFVRFLIDEHGGDKMQALLGDLRDGTLLDPAFVNTYGFDVLQLEDQWRSALGAPSLAAQPTFEAATPVPTLSLANPSAQTAPATPTPTELPPTPTPPPVDTPTPTPQTIAAADTEADDTVGVDRKAVGLSEAKDLSPLQWGALIGILFLFILFFFLYKHRSSSI